MSVNVVCGQVNDQIPVLTQVMSNQVLVCPSIHTTNHCSVELCITVFVFNLWVSHVRSRRLFYSQHTWYIFNMLTQVFSDLTSEGRLGLADMRKVG